jgi:predicted dehydrogenase
VRVGLIADAERLESLAGAIDACVLLQPLGQAGMPAAAAMREVPWFDDPRVLLGQSGLEAVVLATSTRNDTQLAAMAAERGLHVWQLPPLARTFAEATEVAARIRRIPTVHRVASWWEYVTEQVWHDLHWPADFVPLFSEIRVSAPEPAPETGRALLAEAAGGALMDAYPLLEALVALRGLPETVAAAVGGYRKYADGKTRQTEDTAAALLRFGGGGAAILRAAWNLPPAMHELAHYGQTESVTLTEELVSVVGGDGTTIDQRPLPGAFLTHEVLRFGELVRGQARDRAAAPLDRHLAVSALLETVYLAAQTGHPESPGKFYHMQGWPEPRP